MPKITLQPPQHAEYDLSVVYQINATLAEIEESPTTFSPQWKQGEYTAFNFFQEGHILLFKDDTIRVCHFPKEGGKVVFLPLREWVTKGQYASGFGWVNGKAVRPAAA